MNREKESVSDIGVYATNHIKEHLDPKGELPVLTPEQIDIVADRIYEKLKSKRKTTQPFYDEQTDQQTKSPESA